MRGNPREAKLPSEYNVSVGWSIQNNWLLSATLCSPSATRPRTALVLSDLFEGAPGFSEILKGIPMPAATPFSTVPDTAAGSAMVPAGSMPQVASPASSSGSPLGKPGPAMSMSEVGSAVAKLRRKVSAKRG